VSQDGVRFVRGAWRLRDVFWRKFGTHRASGIAWWLGAPFVDVERTVWWASWAVWGPLPHLTVRQVGGGLPLGHRVVRPYRSHGTGAPDAAPLVGYFLGSVGSRPRA
jgi:hypothetical protein